MIYTFGQNESGVYELYSVSSDNSGAIVKLNGPLVAGGSIQRFDISPDGRRVVYQADQDADEVEELYGATLPDAPATEMKLFLPVSLR